MEIELRDTLGNPFFRQYCRYVVILEVAPEFSRRVQTGIVRRDMNANELNSLQLIMRQKERLLVTGAGIRKRLTKRQGLSMRSSESWC